MDNLALWGPIIAAITAILTTVITTKGQLGVVKKQQPASEYAVISGAYTGLVADLQAQIESLQKDFIDAKNRAVEAEDQARQVRDQLMILTLKHEEEINLLHSKINLLESQLRETRKPEW